MLMKNLSWILVTITVFAFGCTTNDDSLKSREVISYYDTNGDGRVDLEEHRYTGVVDADWERRDENYDGRYDKEIIFGIGVEETKVDLPVPTNVPIRRK
jgi:hypothetical protein